MYKENPKTKGSGIVCCIPQDTLCPIKCKDCFFQGGRSYLEPLIENLPNIPESVDFHNIVRVNDGNDSSIDIIRVLSSTSQFKMKFFNTSMPSRIHLFKDPVVLTINPAEKTDHSFHKILDHYKEVPKNLMFVRFRTNTWNLQILREAVQYYGDLQIPIVLTFMAYNETINEMPMQHRNENYITRKRTTNEYCAITTQTFRNIMKYWQDTKYEQWIYSCGKIEGEIGVTSCSRCGNCVREYHNTMERINHER